MNKKSKKLTFLSALGPILGSLFFVSCQAIRSSDDNNDKNGNNKNDNTDIANKDKLDNKPASLVQPKFLISEYFDNLAIKNEKNLTIENWINDFHKDLGVNIKKPFSFNRAAETDVINNANYINKSYERIQDIADKKYLTNSKNNFFRGYGYDIRASKLGDNKIRISVYLYNPNLTTGNIINQNFDLPFIYINPAKEYERLIDPLQAANDQLEELRLIKDNVTIKSDYEKLMNIWAQANDLVVKKVNDAAKITQALNDLNLAKIALNTAKNVLSTQQSLASLQIEVAKQYTLLANNMENEKIGIINHRANDFRELISQVENYIKKGVSDVEKTAKLKAELSQAGLQYQDAINNLPNILNNFIHRFSSNIIVENVKSDSSRILQIYPSELRTFNLSIRDTAQLEDAQVTFTILPHDSFGVVYIGANINYGALNRTVAPVRFNQVFKSRNQLSQYFSSTFYPNAYEIVNKRKWPGGNEALTEALTSSSKILEKLNEILDESKTEDTTITQPVKIDRVATFLWALEYSLSNDKQGSLVKIKNLFLNRRNSDSFSKLAYLTQTVTLENGKKFDYWNAFLTFAKLIEYANLIPTNDPNFARLQDFRDTKLLTFIHGWWRSYFAQYYNSLIVPTNNQWSLFEFSQLYRSIQLFLILQNNLRDTSTFFETINHFAASISEYGHVRNSTSKLSGLIDNPEFAQLAFAARFYYIFNNRDLDTTIKDAADYKKWLENVSYTNLYKHFNNNQSEFLKYLETLKKQNEVYVILKENGSDFGFSFTNFNKLQTWFFKDYLNTEITFDKLNGNQGQTYMSIVAALYSVMKLSPTAQKQFVDQLKQSVLLKGKQKTDFTKLSSLSKEYKEIWDEIFLAQ